MTACKISLTACLPIDIQFSGQTACLIIKCIFIIRITDTRIPQDHRWMIAILHHHFTDISHSNFLPPCIADKLPARNFRNDKQANLIAVKFPLDETFEALRHVEFVMNNGVVIKND